MLITFVDIEDTGFDDAGTVLSLADEDQAQLTVDFAAADRDRVDCVGKRDGCPAIGFRTRNSVISSFYFGERYQRSVWPTSDFVSPCGGGDDEHHRAIVRSV
ncbi:hypothetical protein ACM16X_17985 [Haloarcula japonica]|uniref:hypothetical protein n=1 Tax=Haloarcula japonica TaxID=29282 RepID=UPI0039F73446